jgi:hypothetical protein
MVIIIFSSKEQTILSIYKDEEKLKPSYIEGATAMETV